MSKPTIALVTAAAARDVDEDLPPLESALRNAGADVTVAEWDRPHDWSRFESRCCVRRGITRNGSRNSSTGRKR